MSGSEALTVLEDVRDAARRILDEVERAIVGKRDALAGAAGEQAGAAVARVIDDEVQIGEVAGGSFQVERHAGFLIEEAERQPLVDA